MVDPDLEVGGVCHHERLLALKGPIARRPDGAVQLGAGLKEGLLVDGKVFYRRCGKDSFQVHGNDFFLTRDKE